MVSYKLAYKNKNNTNIAVTPNDINEFFTSIFKQAPIYNNKHPHCLTNDSYIRTNLYLFPKKNYEIISTFSSLSNSNNYLIYDMNDFFTSIFKQAPIYNNKHPHCLTNDSYIRTNLYLFPIKNYEIIFTFSSLSNSRSVSNDGLRPDIIKSIASLISPHFTYILDLSFSQAIFPKLLKTAIVVPIHKTGTYNDSNNYRPISILTILSKLIEQNYFITIYDHLYTKIKYITQLSIWFCKKNISTNTAIMHILSSLFTKCLNNTKIALVMLDLNKVFDFIKHKLLLIKLAHYSIRGVQLKWLSGYLSGRTQQNKINVNFSNLKPISAGCSQCSVFSGLLFNLFINDIFQLISPNIEIYLYADDTAILITADSEDSLQKVINDFCD